MIIDRGTNKMIIIGASMAVTVIIDVLLATKVEENTAENSDISRAE